MAVPPLNPGPEPDNPPGMNCPGQNVLLRDRPDLEGVYDCLVILVDFEDYPWDHQDDENFDNEGNPYTAEHFDEMLFSRWDFVHPGSESEYTGSARDYFTEVSNGNFWIVGVVTEWYRAPHPYSYYCNGDGEFGTDDDFGWGDYPRNSQGLAEDAIMAADEDIDFSRFDNNGDGFAESIFIVHAGPGAELFGRNELGADYIWSHMWFLPEEIQLDGVILQQYAMQPESGCISVFCHEYGHILGLPDLYDIDYSTQGIGEWGLMGKGTWCHRPGDPPGSCPAHMCGWSKMQFNWVDVVEVTEDYMNARIPSVADSAVIYMVFPGGNDDSEEYFLIENRRRTGFDAGLIRRQIIHELPAPNGLLITHIDESRRQDDNSDNADENHRLVDVEEASPVWIDDEPVEQLDVRHNNDWLNLYNGNRGDNGDLWSGYSHHSEDSTNWIGARDRTTFGSNSVPSSLLYNGQPSQVTIRGISPAEDNSYICHIIVNDEAPHLSLENYRMVNTAEGIGFIEPGDLIELFITFKNMGGVTLTDISVELEYNGDLIEVLEDSSWVTNMESDESGLTLTPFVIQLSDRRQNLRPFEITLTVTSEQRDWEFPLTVSPQKHHTNPVIVSDPNSWDSEGIRSFGLVNENDTLKCWYAASTGQNRPRSSAIGYAWSLDGGLTWTKWDEPVLYVDENIELMEMGFSNVDVIRVENGYFMVFVTGWSVFNGYFQGFLWQAFSENGIDWEINPERIIGQNQGWFFCPLADSHPSLFRLADREEVYLAFAAIDRGFMRNGITLASTVDFEHWDIDNQPLFRCTRNNNQFDGGGIFSPDIFNDEGQYLMLYGGINERGQYDSFIEYIGRLGVKTTDDFDDFERYEGFATGGSIVEPDDQTDWTERYIKGGRIFKWNDQYRILYSAYETHERWLAHSPAIGLIMGSSEEIVQRIPSFPEPNKSIPAKFHLFAAYPNPFNNLTRIEFGLPKDSRLKISVYDASGRLLTRLLEGKLSAGYHTTIWDASKASTGMYLVRLETDGFYAARKVVLVK